MLVYIYLHIINMNKPKKAFIYEKKGIDESFYNKERILTTIKDCNIIG